MFPINFYSRKQDLNYHALAEYMCTSMPGAFKSVSPTPQVSKVLFILLQT